MSGFVLVCLQTNKAYHKCHGHLGRITSRASIIFSNPICHSKHNNRKRVSKNAPPTTLPSKRPLLKRPQHQVRNPRKRKRKLKPHIAPVRRAADFLAHGADEPDLRHAHDGAEDAEAEGEDGGHAGGEEVRGVVDGDVVFAFFEDEVFG